MLYPIKGYEAVYSVSPQGVVFSHRHSKIKKLKEQNQGTGYKVVYLYSDTGRETVLIHRAVAEAYIPNPDNKPHVNHKDSCRSNNHRDNLEWCTEKENTQHAIAAGGINQRGSNSVNAKLTEREVLFIRQRYLEGKPLYFLAKEYGVSSSTIKLIVTRQTWRNV